MYSTASILHSFIFFWRPFCIILILLTNCLVLFCSFPISSLIRLYSSLRPSRVLFISSLNCLVSFCSFPIPSLTCSCFSERTSLKIFTSLPDCFVLFYIFPIALLRRLSSSFLCFPRSFFSPKRSFISLFKALSSFEISVFFSLEFLKRSSVFYRELLKIFMSVLILFRSS